MMAPRNTPNHTLTQIGALIPGLALLAAVTLALLAPDAPVADQSVITRDEPVQLDASLDHVKS
jgi:hypothetical protein